MKLLIQIPCYNEAEQLPATVARLPRCLPPFDTVEFLVIDDGSSDNTAEVARDCGVDHVVRLPGHQGLARAFLTGLLACLERGADVIVNTDADGQYDAECLPALVEPIVTGRADLVVGARPIDRISHFSWIKRRLQRLGSRVVRILSGVRVEDAPCGFRAMTRDAALRVQVFNGFTYTLETLVQAGCAGLRVVSVPIAVHPPTRPSRLFRSNLSYVVRSVLVLIGVYTIYRPLRVFGLLGSVSVLLGLGLSLRYLWLMTLGEGRGHVQSVIAAAVFALTGVFFFSLGVLSWLLQINRRLLEELVYRSREQRYSPFAKPDRRFPE